MKYVGYNIKNIVNSFNSGEHMEFVFFWGHTVKPGKITKACLSQWYPCDFRVDGVQYHTTEQYMMSQKALLFGDAEIYRKIMEADHPGKYKDLGRKIRNFEQEKWDAHKFEIVVQGNVAKFSQNKELREFLLNTGNKVLVEASPYDRIWGVNLSMDKPEIQDPNNWKGENLLGFALMETRSVLRSEKIKE